MLQHINELFSQLVIFSKANPIIASAFGLWGLSVVSFLLRDIPSKIWDFMVRQATTTLDLNSQDLIYHEFLEWLSIHKMHKFVRTLNLNNSLYKGSYTTNSDSPKSISFGYGNTFFFHYGKLFLLSRSKDQASNTEMTKETLSITVLGRSQDVFNKLFAEVKKIKEEDQARISIYKFGAMHGWEQICRSYKRDPSTVILNQDVHDKFYDTIDKFLASRSWYRKNGVPYRLGILLSGPPGTGKTSLIKAACAKYDRDLYILNLANITDDRFLEAMASLPEKCIVAIEDIDAHGVSVNRNKSSSKQASLTMSGLLNGIDGAASAEDRILIATTNYIDKIDSALIRDGRFDLKLVLDNMNREALIRYLKNVYKDFIDTGDNLDLNIPTATVQRIVFENQNNYKNVLKLLKSQNNTKIKKK